MFFKSFVLIFRSFVFTLLTETTNFMSNLVEVYAYCHGICPRITPQRRAAMPRDAPHETAVEGGGG